MKVSAGDLFAAIFFLAIVYLLVRPRSAAVDAVRLISDAVTALVGAATDF